MFRTVAIAIGLTALSIPASAQQGERILIFGGREHDQFLGCLTCSDVDSESVWNDVSQFGWANDFGKWNPFGENRNPYSSTSACNEYSSSAPILVDRRGNFYGTLSVNEYAKGSICGASGNEQVCRALRVMCAKN
jgi:hypothetical protein